MVSVGSLPVVAAALHLFLSTTVTLFVAVVVPLTLGAVRKPVRLPRQATISRRCFRWSAIGGRPIDAFADEIGDQLGCVVQLPGRRRG